MRKSRLPAGGTNLFQEIKAVSIKAQEKGAKIIKLSIGQPSGPALSSAREAAAKAVLSDDESMHEYQDNGSPGVPDFAKKFVQVHLRGPLLTTQIDFLPIPGIKPMLGLVPLACGSLLEVVATCTNPGYPTPAVQCRYLGKSVFEPKLRPEKGFLLDVEDLEDMDISCGKIGLVMTNYPHNPSGAVASVEWWREICSYCQNHNIRLFNDAAYIAMSFGDDSYCLSDVAPSFPRLSWAEAFSASKVINNGTGWRIGAMVGSPDFIGDIKTIKGNTDSGFVAPMAAGALYAVENDVQGIKAVVNKYKLRSALLYKILLEAGMQPAIEPRAGFFTLWNVPKRAFGRKIKDAKHFNFLMIEKTGIVGVHFHPYIRYSVASVEIATVADEIRTAFAKAKVSYS